MTRSKIININKLSWVLKVMGEYVREFTITINFGNIYINTQLVEIDWERGEKLIERLVEKNISWKFTFPDGKLRIEIW
jgi:hypothetical protein